MGEIGGVSNVELACDPAAAETGTPLTVAFEILVALAVAYALVAVIYRRRGDRRPRSP